MLLENVSILGCGWLGLPLAKELIRQGVSVKGSTTTPSKIQTLEQAGIQPFLLNVSDKAEVKEAGAFFESDILFLNIPYRRRLPNPSVYKTQIDSVIKHALSGPVRWIIFASSTSVYPPTIKEAKEEMLFEPQTDRAKVLYDVEQSLLNDTRFQSTIIRFGGLYGGSRKIGMFLAGKEGVGRPNAPVNLIHLDDSVSIVTAIIKQSAMGEIFNAVSDRHPSRKELYTAAAAASGVNVPAFADDRLAEGKIVSNQKIKERLSYQFIHPDPMDL